MTDNIKLPPLPPLHIVPSVEPVDYPEVARALMDYARAAVEAELAEVRADAARYRWLRDRWGRVTETYDGDSGRVVEIGTEPDGEGWDVDASSLDAAIDAAIKEQQQ